MRSSNASVRCERRAGKTAREFLYDDSGNTKIGYAALANECKTVAANIGGHPFSVRAGAAEWRGGAGRARP
jgi:hypothetical protein